MMQPWITTQSGSIVYPDSDGKPMADNAKKLRWILTLEGNLACERWTSTTLSDPRC
jgi:hypothetical protein